MFWFYDNNIDFMPFVPLGVVQCVVPENIHSRAPRPSGKFQLSFIHFFFLFVFQSLLLHPQEIQIPPVGEGEDRYFLEKHIKHN